MEHSDPSARPVLVLDFGAVRPAHRPAGPRAARLRPDRPARHHARARPRAEPAGADPLRRAVERLRARGAALRPAVRPGRAGPGHLLRDAAGLRGPRRARSSRARPREFGRAECRVARRRRAACSTASPTTTTVWMSHGDQVHDAGGDFVPLAATATCPVAAVRHRDAAGLRPAVPPRGRPHAVRRADPRQLPRPGLRLPAAPGRWRRSSTAPSSEIRARVGPTDRVVCGLSGGVDSAVVRGPAGARRSGRRSSASSSTTACSARASATRSADAFGDHSDADLRVVDASRPVPRRARRA